MVGSKTVNERVLFAGPYIGEFGHEVLGTGLLRAHARHFGKVIVCSRPERAALYYDIATEFRSHSIKCVGIGSKATEDTKPPTALLDSLQEPGCTRWPNYFVPPNCGIPKTEEDIIRCHSYYHALGNRRDEWRDVAVFHARNRPHQLERNWPLENWEELARCLLDSGIVERIVCVGSRGEARAVPCCLDMRGSPLGKQMDIGASARFAVGPSSGWMHLASLCKCPHLTWVGGAEHVYVKRRYLDRWNPLGTIAAVLPEPTWQPTLDSVIRGLAVFLERI